MQAFIAETQVSKLAGLEQMAFWTALTAAGLGLAVVALPWIPQELAAWLSAGLLLAEAIGLAVFAALLLKREVPKLRRAREQHADEMDVDFNRWQEIVIELEQFPTPQREKRLRFAQRLRTSMAYRMGLALGGIERLGLFPVLVALYLQFRDWRWGDWTSAFDVNPVAGLLIWMMLLLYGAGWLLVGLRSRLDTYVDLLEESVQA